MCYHPEFFFLMWALGVDSRPVLTRKEATSPAPPTYVLCHLFSVTVLHYEDDFLFPSGRTRPSGELRSLKE